MKPKIVIVEDGEDFAAAIVDALEKFGDYKYEIHYINPSIITPIPTFEELHDLISQKLGSRGILLLDNRLGWKWTGAHLAPSFESSLISISSDTQKWAEINFENKHCLRNYFQFKEGEVRYRDAVVELNTHIRELLAQNFGPDYNGFLETNL